MIDLTNWEEHLLLCIDDELLPAEAAELKAFLAAHPELAAEVAAYEATVLLPVEEGFFEQKETLYQPVSRRFNLRPVLWAAAAILLLAVGFNWNSEKEVPKVATLPKKEGAVPVPPATLPAEVLSPAPPPTPVKSAVQGVAGVAQKSQARLEKKSVVQPKKEILEASLPAEIALLPAQEDRSFAIAADLPVTAQFQNVETLVIAEIPKEKEGFVVQVPLISALKKAAQDGFPRIEAAREKVRGTETTVMLFDHKLFTINL